jgi:hypothetical protein
MTQIRTKGFIAHACYKDVYKEKKGAIEQTFRDAALKKVSHGPKSPKSFLKEMTQNLRKFFIVQITKFLYIWKYWTTCLPLNCRYLVQMKAGRFSATTFYTLL